METVITSQLQFSLLNINHGDKRYLSSLGNYDVCMNIESPEYDDKHKITGKWCPLDFTQNNIKIDVTNAEVFLNMFKQTRSKGLIGEIYSKLDEKDVIELSRLSYISDRKDTQSYISGVCIPINCDPIQLSHVINKGNQYNSFTI